MASGFVDRRSEIPPELHGQSQAQKSGWLDSNQRRLAPKASGPPLPHILKMESARFELAITGLQDQRLANLATTPTLSDKLSELVAGFRFCTSGDDDKLWQLVGHLQ